MLCFWVADVMEVTSCESLQEQYSNLYERNKKLHENVQLCSDVVAEMRASQEGGGVARSCGGEAKQELIDTVPHCDVSGSVKEVTM